MFTSPPPLTKPHWVYEDPSGVAEPATRLLFRAPHDARAGNLVARPWRRRKPATRSTVTVRRTRIVHREA